MGPSVRLTRLRSLDLSCNNIAKIEGLAGCTDIRDLALYSNKIERVESINQCRELRRLQLQFNRITEIDTRAAFAGLKALTCLRVSHNRIARMDVLPASLVHVDLSSNPLASVDLTGLSALQELSLDHTNISELPQVLTRCPALRELRASHTQIASFAFVVTRLLKLETLDVSCTCIKSIGDIGPSEQLKQLYTAGNRLASLPAEMPTMYPHLEVLDVSDNEIADAAPLLKVLTALGELEELRLRGNPLCSKTKTYEWLVCERLPKLHALDGLRVRRDLMQQSIFRGACSVDVGACYNHDDAQGVEDAASRLGNSEDTAGEAVNKALFSGAQDHNVH
eukprot:m51a1_g2481 putative small gtp-binding protein (337) ;mRNA; r:73687-75023